MEDSIEYLSVDQQIKAAAQKRMLKKANKILAGTGIDPVKHREVIIDLMKAEPYRKEVNTIVLTLEFSINALVNSQNLYFELAEDSTDDQRIMYFYKAEGLKEGVEFLTKLKNTKEAHL